jgi:RimJ/RimL family protein N-acetyltransferase
VILETRRLVLRPLAAQDAAEVQVLAERREVAEMLISVPYPWPRWKVEQWIAAHEMAFAEGRSVVFGSRLKQDGKLIGVVGVREIDINHSQAEVGFWVGVQWWGRGYATEGLGAVLQFGFEHMRLNRMYGYHLVRNSASGRVMEKSGMRREGLLRQRVKKGDIFEDVIVSAIVASDVAPWADGGTSMQDRGSSGRRPQQSQDGPSGSSGGDRTQVLGVHS